MNLTVEQRGAVADRVLHSVENESIIKEARRLHGEGIPQADAVKRAAGWGGSGGPEGLSWETAATGIRVWENTNLDDAALIPWSEVAAKVFVQPQEELFK